MRKRFAVAYISFFDNLLKMHFTSAETWHQALSKSYPELADSLSEDLDEAKSQAFDMDLMFEVREIPKPQKRTRTTNE